jgi:uncharacterized membrane protein
VSEDEAEHPALESHGPIEHRLHPPTRLLALSDGIFAIAMTLLALEIHVPDDLADDAAFNAEMPAFLSSLGVFVAAFLITGQYWLGHHRTLSYVHTVDRRLLVESIYPLLGVAAIPAAARLIVEDSDHWLAIVAAALVLAATSLLSVRFYRHALRPEFAEIPPADRRRALFTPAFGAVVYLVTAALAAVLHAAGLPPEIAFWAWFLLPLSQRAGRWVAKRPAAG